MKEIIINIIKFGKLKSNYSGTEMFFVIDFPIIYSEIFISFTRFQSKIPLQSFKEIPFNHSKKYPCDYEQKLLSICISAFYQVTSSSTVPMKFWWMDYKKKILFSNCFRYKSLLCSSCAQTKYHRIDWRFLLYCHLSQ